MQEKIPTTPEHIELDLAGLPAQRIAMLVHKLLRKGEVYHFSGLPSSQSKHSVVKTILRQSEEPLVVLAFAAVSNSHTGPARRLKYSTLKSMEYNAPARQRPNEIVPVPATALFRRDFSVIIVGRAFLSWLLSVSGPASRSRSKTASVRSISFWRQMRDVSASSLLCSARTAAAFPSRAAASILRSNASWSLPVHSLEVFASFRPPRIRSLADLHTTNDPGAWPVGWSSFRPFVEIPTFRLGWPIEEAADFYFIITLTP